MLYSPWERWPSLSFDPRPSDLSFLAKDCGYLHLKYCKPDPYENFSSEFAELIKIGVVPGPDLPFELRGLAESYQTDRR